MMFRAIECACSNNLKELPFDVYKENPGNLDGPFLLNHTTIKFVVGAIMKGSIAFYVRHTHN